jgi:RimJ/RimL family protein N-acetyltransferase
MNHRRREIGIRNISIGSGVALRELYPEDASAVLQLTKGNNSHLAMEQVYKMCGIEKGITHEIENDDNVVEMGIWEGGVLAGYIKLTSRERTVVEVEYWLGSGFEGRELVLKAIAKIWRRCLDYRTFNFMVAKTIKENERSVHLLYKMNFVPFWEDKKHLYFFKERWPIFAIDATGFCGVIFNRTYFNNVVTRHFSGDLEKVLSFRARVNRWELAPHFGNRDKHARPLTLGSWLYKNAIDVYT